MHSRVSTTKSRQELPARRCRPSERTHRQQAAGTAGRSVQHQPVAQGLFQDRGEVVASLLLDLVRVQPGFDDPDGRFGAAVSASSQYGHSCAGGRSQIVTSTSAVSVGSSGMSCCMTVASIRMPATAASRRSVESLSDMVDPARATCWVAAVHLHDPNGSTGDRTCASGPSAEWSTDARSRRSTPTMRFSRVPSCHITRANDERAIEATVSEGIGEGRTPRVKSMRSGRGLTRTTATWRAPGILRSCSIRAGPRWLLTTIA